MGAKAESRAGMAAMIPVRLFGAVAGPGQAEAPAAVRSGLRGSPDRAGPAQYQLWACQKDQAPQGLP